MKKYKIFILLLLLIIFINPSATLALENNICTNPTYKDNQILVKFKKKYSDSTIRNFASQYNLAYSPNENSDIRNGYFLFNLQDDKLVSDTIITLQKDSKVKKAQPNYLFQTAKKKVKSNQDKYFNREWWLYNNGRLGAAGSDLYVLPVWNQEKTNWPGIVIGIIDSGVNPRHTDLKKNIVRGYDFVHNTSKKMADKEGHGSFIAGLIASQVNNRKGIAGLSRQNLLKIMPLKFDFSTDGAIQAIVFAQNKGVRILNTSWGTDEYDPALYEAIKSYNGLVVAAAGNDGLEHTDTHHFYPCDFDLDNILCVGASSETDQITSYSDWGSSVDILSPGGENAPLLSLDVKTNHYAEGMGTSFSTGLASGAAGLVLSANPSISNLEIKNVILLNARKKDELIGKVTSSGILNIKAAVNKENSNY